MCFFYRFIFLYFIQTKGFLNNNPKFLSEHLAICIEQNSNFYHDFLKKLFFNILNTPCKDRINTDAWSENISFLNGGLFRPHPLEEKYKNITIQNTSFESMLNFLSKWLWYVDETADSAEDTAINPEILGNIFEKSITDQKGKGAYYTPSNLTKFITESSLISYCLDRIYENFGTKYDSLDEISNKVHLEYLYFDVVKPITVLDNACGSGEFILSTSKLLFETYSSIWDKIKDRKNAKILAEKKTHGNSTHYYFRRRIITSNLYGLDRESEAVEICKLRLWLSLVSEMDVKNVEPLPNIDYNILNGNALTGYVDFPKIIQTTMDGTKPLVELVKEIGDLNQSFKGETNPKKTKKLMLEIDERTKNANKILDKFRMNELGKLKEKQMRNFKNKACFITNCASILYCQMMVST